MKEHKTMISAAEGVKIAMKRYIAPAALQCAEIRAEYKKADTMPGTDPNGTILLAICYEIGRMQGIREERSRRKSDRNK